MLTAPAEYYKIERSNKITIIYIPSEIERSPTMKQSVKVKLVINIGINYTIMIYVNTISC